MSLVTVGDNVVDWYPSLGWGFPGGNAFNVAVHAHRSGLSTAYVGAVGTDRAGRHLVETLRHERVATSRLRVIDGDTATCEIALIDGDRKFVDSTQGVSFFTLDDDDLDYIANFPLAYSSYCSGMEEQVGDIAQRAPLVFDFSDRRSPDYAEPILEHCQIAAFSASDLDATETHDLIEWAQSLGPRQVLATRGHHGAVWADGDQLHHQPARPTEIVDTLGAGDAFLARVLVGLARSEDPLQFLPEAADRAAEVCTVNGAVGHRLVHPQPNDGDPDDPTSPPSPATLQRRKTAR